MANDLKVTATLTDNISPALKSIESGIIRVVGAFSALLTAVTAIGAPIRFAAEYQASLLQVQKTTNYTTEATAYLGEELVKLSRQVNISAVDLAKIAALGGQLGVGDAGAAALVTFTEEIARGVTALDVSAEAAATSVGKLIKIFDIQPDKFRNVISTISQIANVSTAKPEELFDILRRIGSLGGTVTLDQATALSAVMVDLGFTAETAGTSILKVFSDMQSKAGEFGSFVGQSTKQWSDLVNSNGVGALNLYLDTLNKLPAATAAAFKEELTGGGRIASLVTKLQAERLKGGGIMSATLKAAAAEMAEGTSAARQQQIVLSGLTASWDLLVNSVKALFITSGQETLTPLTVALRALNSALADPALITAFSSGAKDLVRILSIAATGLQNLLSYVSAIGIQWEGAFKLAAFSAVILGVQALGRVLVGTFSKIQTSIFSSSSAVAAGAAAEITATNAVVAALQRKAARIEANLVARKLAAAQERQIAFAEQAEALRTAAVAALRANATTYNSPANVARKNAQIAILEKQGAATIAEIDATITANNNNQLGVRIANYRTYLLAKQRASAEVEAQIAAQAALVSANGAAVLPQASIFARMTQQATQFRALGFGQYMLALAGATDRYAAATTRLSRGLVGASAAVTLFGRAASAALALIGRSLSLVLTVVLIVPALLEMLGVLDNVKDAIADLLKLFGVKVRPKFLNTASSDKALEEYKKKQEEIAALKQRFDQQFGSIVIQIRPVLGGEEDFKKKLAARGAEIERVQEGIKQRLKFSTENVDDSSKAVTDQVNLLTTFSTGVVGATNDLDNLIKKEAEYAAALKQAREELAASGARFDSSNAGDSTAQAEKVAKLQKAYDDIVKSGAIEKARQAVVQNEKAKVDAIETTLSALTRGAGAALFASTDKYDKGRLVALQELGKEQGRIIARYKEIAGASANVRAPSRTDTLAEKNVEEAQKLQDEIRRVDDEVKSLSTEILKIPDVSKQFVNPGLAVAGIRALTTEANTLRDAAFKAEDAGKNLFKGLGKVVLPRGVGIESIAATIALAQEAEKTYARLALIAKAEADNAKNAVARAIDKNKQDYREFADFLIRVSRNLSNQQDKANTQVKTRAIDDGSATRLDGLNKVKALENEILDTIKSEGFISTQAIRDRLQGLERAALYARDELAKMLLNKQITKEQYDQQTRALDDNLDKSRTLLDYYYQNVNITKEEAAAVQQVLDLKYKAKEQAITDDTSTQKSKLAIDSITQEFGRMKLAANSAVVEIEGIDRALATGDLSSNEKVDLLKKRAVATEALAAATSQMRAEVEKFSNIDPVGGKVVIDTAQVEQMRSAVKSLTDAQADLRVSGASQEQPIYAQAAQALEAQAKFAQATAVENIKLAESQGVANEELARYIALAKELPAVEQQLAGFRQAVSRQASEPAISTDRRALTKQIEDLAKEINSNPTDADYIKMRVTLDTASSDTALTALKETIATAAGDSAKAVNAAGGLDLDATVTIKGVELAPGVKLPEGSFAAGASTPALATGGPIRGAGTGTSDSILAWLSHDEHVIDTTTIRMFGHGFFNTLRSLAKRGINLGNLRNSLQGYAGGGGVNAFGLSSLNFGGLQSIAENGGSMDTMQVDLTVNGKKRSRLRGSREQVSAFVDAVRDVQKGMA